MTLREALDRLAVLEANGWDFHYTSCGVYNQGLFTTAKRRPPRFWEGINP